MAERAIDARLLFVMTFDAPAHGHLALAEQPIALHYLAVTFLALVIFFETRPVAEAHPLGNAVDPHPSKFAFLLAGGGEFLDMRAIGLHRGMALETDGRFGDPHHLTRIRIRMTLLALELEIACMPLMAERDRLFGTGRRSLRQPQRQARDECSQG